MWISVTKGLPPARWRTSRGEVYSDYVLVYGPCDLGHKSFPYLERARVRYYPKKRPDWDGTFEFLVTHWMPFPTPPTAETVEVREQLQPTNAGTPCPQEIKE